MTTVAWDGRSIAADRRMVGEGIASTTGKLFKLKNGCILSGAGYLDQVLEVAAWINGGCKEDKKPKFPEDLNEGSSLLLVDPKGRAYYLTWPYLRRLQINEKFAAIGSGSHFAMGAMAAGADARQAVAIAARFDPNTGGGVNVLRVRG